MSGTVSVWVLPWEQLLPSTPTPEGSVRVRNISREVSTLSLPGHISGSLHWRPPGSVCCLRGRGAAAGKTQTEHLQCLLPSQPGSCLAPDRNPKPFLDSDLNSSYDILGWSMNSV